MSVTPELPSLERSIPVIAYLLTVVIVLVLIKSFESKLRGGQNGKKILEEYKGFYNLPGPRPFPLRFIGNALQIPARRSRNSFLFLM